MKRLWIKLETVGISSIWIPVVWNDSQGSDRQHPNRINVRRLPARRPVLGGNIPSTWFALFHSRGKIFHQRHARIFSSLIKKKKYIHSISPIRIASLRRAKIFKQTPLFALLRFDDSHCFSSMSKNNPSPWLLYRLHVKDGNYFIIDPIRIALELRNIFLPAPFALPSRLR